MSESIITAESESDYRSFAALIVDYVDWTRLRYQDQAWFVDAIFGHQSLEDELNALARIYGAPDGRTLLAYRDGELVGCGAYRRLSDRICEMKRLFVAPRFHGAGSGRRLATALMDAARGAGYEVMRLDTALRLTEAIAMYRSLGFRPCRAYHEYPPEFAANVLFMEVSLAGGA